jgi:hypothetical protein
MMGRQESDGNHSAPKNKLVQYSEGNKKNVNPGPKSNKTEINLTKELNKAHKNNLKEEILQLINENFIEMLTDMVNQNVQQALKKIHDNKNKEYKKTQKQINEITGVLDKHQSKTKNTINRNK